MWKCHMWIIKGVDWADVAAIHRNIKIKIHTCILRLWIPNIWTGWNLKQDECWYIQDHIGLLRHGCVHFVLLSYALKFSCCYMFYNYTNNSVVFDFLYLIRSYKKIRRFESSLKINNKMNNSYWNRLRGSLQNALK